MTDTFPDPPTLRRTSAACRGGERRSREPIAALVVAFRTVTRRPWPLPTGEVAAHVLRHYDVVVPRGFAAAFDRRIGRFTSTVPARTARLPAALAAAVADVAVRLPGDLDMGAVLEQIAVAAPEPAIDPQAATAIRVLHERGWPVYMACGTRRCAQVRERTLRAAHLLNHVTGLIMPDTLGGAAPPSLDYYRAAIDRIAKPDYQILWIGNRVRTDVQLPRRARMRALFVVDDRRSEYERGALPNGVPIVATISRLPSSLARRYITPGHTLGQL